MGKFEELEASRKARTSGRGYWAVWKVNDNGVKLVWKRGLTEAAADKLAGRMRDTMPDKDVDAGWNYIVRPAKTGRIPLRPRV